MNDIERKLYEALEELHTCETNLKAAKSEVERMVAWEKEAFQGVLEAQMKVDELKKGFANA